MIAFAAVQGIGTGFSVACGPALVAGALPGGPESAGRGLGLLQHRDQPAAGGRAAARRRDHPAGRLQRVVRRGDRRGPPVQRAGVADPGGLLGEHRSCGHHPRGCGARRTTARPASACATPRPARSP